MHKGKTVCVVVPTSNDEAHIGTVLDTMPDFVDRIIVVANGSRDHTELIARSFSQKQGRILVHSFPEALGVGGAIVQGHRFNLESARPTDISVVMAGDGQMDPEALPRLLDPLLEGYDYSKSNRFMRFGSLRGMPRLRIFGNILLTLLEKASSGYWQVFDPMSGYTAIRREILESISLDSLPKRHDFELGVLIQLGAIGARVSDVDIPSRYGNERSKLHIGDFVMYAVPLLVRGFLSRVYRKYIVRDFHPCAIMLLAGLPLFSFGLLYGLVLLIQKWLGSVGTPTTGTVMLSVLPLILGLQLLLSGLQMDIEESRRRA